MCQHWVWVNCDSISRRIRKIVMLERSSNGAVAATRSGVITIPVGGNRGGEVVDLGSDEEGSGGERIHFKFS
jgi:hypothetical protein